MSTKYLKNITIANLFHTKSGSIFPPNTDIEINVDNLSLFLDEQMKAWLTGSEMEYYDGVRRWGPSQEAWDKFSNRSDEIDYRYESKEPTGFHLVNGDLCTGNIISFNDSTRTFTISPNIGADCFEFFCAGVRIVKTAPESIVIPNLEGSHYIYYIHDVLTTSQTPWKFGEETVFITIIDWDQTNQKRKQFEEERHGNVMDWATHQRLHRVTGSQIELNTFELQNYVLNGDGSSNTHAQIGLTNGTLYDEDIIMHITHSANPTQAFQQILQSAARLPIFYKKWESGLNMNTWRVLEPTEYAVATNGNNPIFYNYYDMVTGRWSLQTSTSGYYVAMWLLITNNRDVGRSVILVLGQSQSVSLLDANNNNLVKDLNLEGFGSPEKYNKYRFIFRTDSTYTNVPKAALINFNDISDEPPIVQGVVPPFVFSRQGTANQGSYLATGTVTTDQAGQPIKGFNYAVEISATNKNVLGSPVRIQFQRRTGANTFVDIPNAYVDITTGNYSGRRTGISIPIGPDWEIACYVSSGNGLSNIVTIIYLTN